MSVTGAKVGPEGEKSLFEAVLEDFLLLLLLEGSLDALPSLESTLELEARSFPLLDEEDLTLGDLEVSCGVVCVPISLLLGVSSHVHFSHQSTTGVQQTTSVPKGILSVPHRRESLKSPVVASEGAINIFGWNYVMQGMPRNS